MPFPGVVDWDPESARSLISGAGTEAGRPGRELFGRSSSSTKIKQSSKCEITQGYPEAVKEFIHFFPEKQRGKFAD